MQAGKVARALLTETDLCPIHAFPLDRVKLDKHGPCHANQIILARRNRCQTRRQSLSSDFSYFLTNRKKKCDATLLVLAMAVC